MAYAYCAVAAFLIVEGLSGAAIYQAFNSLIGITQRPDLAQRNVAQGGYLLAVMLWPAAMTLRRDKLDILVLLLADGVLGVMLTLGTDSPMVALLAGGAAFAAVMRWGRKGVVGVGAAWVAYWLLAPWLVLTARGCGLLAFAKALLPQSWDARLDIWSFAADLIQKKPVSGWGVGASRVFPQIPLHTHNAAIQHWLELGVVGAILAAAVWAWLFGLIARRAEDRGWAATATAALTTFLTISALSFSAWEEWWLGAGSLGLVACIALGRFWQGRVDEKPSPPPRKPSPGPLTLLLRRPWGKSPAFRRVKTP
jgi:O-antigen ligase